MARTRSLKHKLTLETQTVRVLSDTDLKSVAGGFSQSAWSMCVSNGEGNDCYSNMGDCSTMQPRPSRRGC